MSWSTFLAGFLHMLVSVAIRAWLLTLAAPDTYGGRLTLAFVAGLAGSVFSNLGKPIGGSGPGTSTS